MNRKQLLAALKAEGFEGGENATLEAVQKFVAEKFPGGIEDDTGKPIDVEAAFKALPPRRLSAPKTEDEPTGKDASVKATAKIGAPAVHLNFARKNYEAKIKAGRAKFADADTAELMGAGLRSMTMAAVGFEGYKQADNDRSILGNAGIEVVKTADGITIGQKAGSTAVNSLGGALVNTEFYDQLMWLSELYGVSRVLARVVPMRSDTTVLKRKTAIPSFNAISQGASNTAQDTTYDNYRVTAEKFAAYVLTNSELEDDAAVSIADDLGQSFAEGVAKRMDECYFIGDGSSTYNGFTGLSGALPSSAYISASGNSWSAIAIGDVDKLPGAIQNANMARCAFACPRQFDFQVLNPFRYARGGTQAVQFSRGEGLASANPPALRPQSYYLGFPVYHVQVMPSVSASATTFLYFGEFDAASTIGDRRTLTVKRSDATALQTDQIATLATARFGVTIQGDGRGSTYGPIVALKTT